MVFGIQELGARYFAWVIPDFQGLGFRTSRFTEFENGFVRGARALHRDRFDGCENVIFVETVGMEGQPSRRIGTMNQLTKDSQA